MRRAFSIITPASTSSSFDRRRISSDTHANTRDQSDRLLQRSSCCCAVDHDRQVAGIAEYCSSLCRRYQQIRPRSNAVDAHELHWLDVRDRVICWRDDVCAARRRCTRCSTVDAVFAIASRQGLRSVKRHLLGVPRYLLGTVGDGLFLWLVDRSVMPNSQRRRQRDETVDSSCVASGGVN